MIPLTSEDKERLRNEIFKERPDRLCEDCGGYHLRACPRIKRLVLVGEGQSVGNRVEVEYWPAWDESNTTYPEEVWEEEEA
jgi:hypothetical protein